MKIVDKKTLLLGVKKIADKQITDAVKGKCLFLCYQPEIPKQIKNMTK